jgi:hypothetical protein
LGASSKATTPANPREALDLVLACIAEAPLSCYFRAESVLDWDKGTEPPATCGNECATTVTLLDFSPVHNAPFEESDRCARPVSLLWQ